MAKLKTHYVLIHSVIKDIKASDIKRAGSNDTINFTNHEIPVTKRMQLVPKLEDYIPHIMAAFTSVFPGCTNPLVKLIRSNCGDTPRLTHKH